MKKIINISIILLLLGLSLGDITANANEITEADFEVTNIDTGIKITRYTGIVKDVVIPETINGQPVTVIGYSAFENKKLTSVTIPSSIISIEDAAFSTNELTSVTIPDSVISIGNSAFYANKLTHVTIPNSVTSLEAGAFSTNELTSVTIPDSVTSIERYAFVSNKLTSVTIPSSVTSIGVYAFHLNQLNQVEFEGQTTVTPTSFGGQYSDGRDFLEWYVDPLYNNHWRESVPGPMTIYSKWDTLQYKLTFQAYGGSLTPSQIVDHNGKVTAPSDPTREGYIFGGWYKESAQNNLWDFATDVVTKDTTLYAKWNIAQYHLAFNSDGGTVVPSQFIAHNKKGRIPPTPTKEGYTFGGWYKESTLTNQWDFYKDAVTKDTTLHAKWDVAQVTQYELAFNPHGGTVVPSQLVAYKSKGNEPPAPTKEGYTFGGWYKESTLRNQWDFYTDVVTEDTTLYAKWDVTQVVQYELAFNPGGGTDVPSQLVTYNSKGNEPPAPTKEGYIFGGWYKESTLTNQWDFYTDVVTEDTTLYAKWDVTQVVQYELAFNPGGGTAVPSQLVTYNSKGNEPPAPTKEGYTFGGWYKESTLTNQWDFAKEVITGETTLYAKWIKNSSSENNGGGYIPTASPNLTVLLETNGGDSLGSLSVPYDKKIAEIPIPTREGFTFGGWYKESALINPWDLTTDRVSKDTKLYAKWIANTDPESKPNPVPEQPKPEQPMVTFNDISNQWAKEMIEELIDRGIIIGYPDGSFRPDEAIQRQHMALIFTRAFDFESIRESIAFSDLRTNHPHYEAVMSLQQAGIIDGSRGKFHPTALLTRAQMAKIVVLALGVEPGGISNFKDVPTTHWGNAYIAALAELEIVLGDNGKFKPDDPVTRAEFVAIMYRALNLK
ncbi:Listeria/Bacterioides repeat-containing protein [Lysinibacillus fusiformis]|uniref:InlB B-repeat-containing protein n=1 Tax=Lysinibacillus fusiformis TaxID=28031 RepID=UPI00088C03C8|nr:InlB B-repeat-containing protein [Lysinibacillus fusiformis]SCX63262.1 Listeria/Bacterioides repeat-containing protein [Lysinibacillus fusiformis]